MSPSPMQILVIALIILLLFGASRLGEVGKGLGEGIKNFKKGISGDGDDEDAEAKGETKQLKDTEESGKSSPVEEKREKKA